MSKVKGLFKALNYIRGARSTGKAVNHAVKSKTPSLKNMKEYGSTIWEKSKVDYRDAGKYMAQFKDPVNNVSKNLPKNIKMPKMQHDTSAGRAVRTSLGNTADSLLKVTKDVKGKGVIGGTAQVGKNFGELTKQQLKGDLYKEVFNPVVYKKNGKSYLKTKSKFMKDRKVVSTTNRDSVIVRKRKALTPVSIALGGSGASIGAASYALSNKNKPQSKRLQEAAVDTALFTVSAPVGLAVALSRGAKATQRKKQKEIK